MVSFHPLLVVLLLAAASPGKTSHPALQNIKPFMSVLFSNVFRCLVVILLTSRISRGIRAQLSSQMWFEAEHLLDKSSEIRSDIKFKLSCSQVDRLTPVHYAGPALLWNNNAV